MLCVLAAVLVSTASVRGDQAKTGEDPNSCFTLYNALHRSIHLL